MHYDLKPAKLIQKLANKQIASRKRQYVATMLTDPVLKHIPGPNATRPLREGDDPTTFPNSVLAWFCTVKMDAGGEVIDDVIVPTQARGNIGRVGSPVLVWKEPTTGAWQLIGRADRKNEFQSVRSYTLLQLGLGFVRGLVQNVNGDWVSPFWQYTQSDQSVVTATRDGKKQAGLNRGIDAFDTNGNPIVSYVVGQSIELVPLGEWVLGVDALGAYYVVTRHSDGSTSKEKRNRNGP